MLQVQTNKPVLLLVFFKMCFTLVFITCTDKHELFIKYPLHFGIIKREIQSCK